MRTWLALAAILVASLGGAPPLHAQTAVGTWQLTIDGNRQVAKIARARDGSLHGAYYALGQDDAGQSLTATVRGRHVHFTMDENTDISFDGELSADGNTLTGRVAYGSKTFPPTTYRRATAKTAWVIDPSPHKVLLVPVEKDVRLEVLDWGGNGPPLIFVPGLGNTAHVFDHFAPLFTGRHHVYGITRRGFGVSGRPAPTPENYDADRMGDDVLAVIDALKLDRPVIAAHSLGGEELSSVGTRHPEKVSGLIYLDASYEYAFYGPKAPDTWRARQVVFATMRRDLLQAPAAPPSEAKALVQEMQAMLPQLQEDLRKFQDQGTSAPPVPLKPTPTDRIEDSIKAGMRMYPAVKVPVLAIVASPHACAAECDTAQYKADEAEVAVQADAFQTATPQARVVRMAKADHYVFRSNQAEVVREMNAFMEGLR